MVPGKIQLPESGQAGEALNSSPGQWLLPSWAAAMSRIPAGHPEGYYSMFANTYLKFTNALLQLKQGLELSADDLDFPDAKVGAQGVKFIHRCVESSKRGSVWVKFD